MAWVITRLCRDCKNHSCVDVCPVDCIFDYTGKDREAFPNQLYIDPDVCISCGACEPECPWDAIYPEEKVPPALSDDIELNRKMTERKDQFVTAAREALPKPSAPDVQANKKKWGI